MIFIKDLFKQLATGEFSGISIGNSPTGGINESEYEKIINHTNSGILEIYKRFKFLENELILHIYPEVTKYYLRPERMASLSNINSNRYIEKSSSSEGFLNIIKVTSVFSSSGEELNFNDRFSIPSIRQLSFDTLSITNVDSEQVINIVYQSYPKKIDITTNFDPLEYTIDIPEIIVNPLLYYVAARVYKPMGSNDSTANADKSSSYDQQYELACQKILLYGLSPQNGDSPNTFIEKGWA